MNQANPQTAEMEDQMSGAIPPKLRAFGEKERFWLSYRHIENGETSQQLFAGIDLQLTETLSRATGTNLPTNDSEWEY